MNTTKYKTIISVLSISYPEFGKYIEMCKRLDLFMETDGASEAGKGLEESFLAEFALLQEKLYLAALEKKRTQSC